MYQIYLFQGCFYLGRPYGIADKLQLYGGHY